MSATSSHNTNTNTNPNPLATLSPSRSGSPDSCSSSSNSTRVKHELDDDLAQANLTPSNKRSKPMSSERIARLEARQARNRASAQASRDKKKAFFTRLEHEHRVLVQENAWLKQQNNHLYTAVMDFEKRLQMAEGVIDVLTKQAHGNMSLSQAQTIAQTQLASPPPSSGVPSPDAHMQRSLSLPQYPGSATAPHHPIPMGRAFPPSLHGELPTPGSNNVAALVTPPSAPMHNQYSALANGFPFPVTAPAPTSVAPTDLAVSPSTSEGSAAPAQLMSSSGSVSSLSDQTVVGDWNLESQVKKELVDVFNPTSEHTNDHSSLGAAFTVNMRKSFAFGEQASPLDTGSPFNAPLSVTLE